MSEICLFTISLIERHVRLDLFNDSVSLRESVQAEEESLGLIESKDGYPNSILGDVHVLYDTAHEGHIRVPIPWHDRGRRVHQERDIGGTSAHWNKKHGQHLIKVE